MIPEMKNILKKYFSNRPKAVFFLVLVSMCFFTVFFGLKKSVFVVIDGKQQQITTLRGKVKTILSENNIVLGPKDKVTPSLDSKVKNGDKIIIKSAIEVTVLIDGKELRIKSSKDNVGQMLTEEKINLGEEDKILPAQTDILKQGMKVEITRVNSKIVKEVQPIDFATVVRQDDNLEKGTDNVVQEGQQGNKEITTKIVYENGKEVSRDVLKEEIMSDPVEKIVAQGTLGSITSSRGGKILYTESLQVKATAYTSDYESTGKHPGDYEFGITATGTHARRSNEGYSSIAVDPRVIPLGTKLYVPDYGYAIAEDVGGAIKGDRIDVYFDSESEARRWGVKWVTVYILK